jgi:excisionase family DNA binding protein
MEIQDEIIPRVVYSVYLIDLRLWRDHVGLMKRINHRVDGSLLTDAERGDLKLLLDLMQKDAHPRLKGADGTEIPIPQPIFEVLARVAQDMRHGRAVVLIPEDEAFTTQAAANYLGMSRQYLVKLLEEHQLPFHRVGSHRRVTFKDLRDYESKRYAERHAGVNRLFARLQGEGHYDTDYTGDDAR